MADTIVSGPAALNWVVYSGDKNTEVFSIESGDPVDITGATIDAQARRSVLDPYVALVATVELTSPQAGSFEVSWDGEQVRDLLAGAERWEGVWDLQILMPDETLPRTLLRGDFVAVLDITRQDIVMRRG
jgi:hypothetical protein